MKAWLLALLTGIFASILFFVFIQPYLPSFPQILAGIAQKFRAPPLIRVAFYEGGCNFTPTSNALALHTPISAPISSQLHYAATADSPFGFLDWSNSPGWEFVDGNLVSGGLASNATTLAPYRLSSRNDYTIELDVRRNGSASNDSPKSSFGFTYTVGSGPDNTWDVNCHHCYKALSSQWASVRIRLHRDARPEFPETYDFVWYASGCPNPITVGTLGGVPDANGKIGLYSNKAAVEVRSFRILTP